MGRPPATGLLRASLPGDNGKTECFYKVATDALARSAMHLRRQGYLKRAISAWSQRGRRPAGWWPALRLPIVTAVGS